MIPTKLHYLGLIVAALMFFLGVISIFAGLVPLIIMGTTYELGNTLGFRTMTQNLLGGIILVTPGSILFWKSKMRKELLRK